MRDCSSVRRAVVAAGVRPRARSTSAVTSMADSSAPQAALASHGGEGRHIGQQHGAGIGARQRPSTTPAAYCWAVLRRCSTVLRLQAVPSQTSVAGKAPPVSRGTVASHW